MRKKQSLLAASLFSAKERKHKNKETTLGAYIYMVLLSLKFTLIFRCPSSVIN